MENRSGLIDLPDAALDQVAGGCRVCTTALIQGNGDPNFKANSPNTGAADLGLSFDKKPGSGKPGAYVGCADDVAPA